MYAAIRQFKARPGSADALAEKIKEAISLISDVSGFMAYYVIYAPDDMVTAITASTPSRKPRSPTGGRSPSSRIISGPWSSGTRAQPPGR
jgi:hypothetical protein